MGAEQDPLAREGEAKPAEPALRSGFVALCGRPNVGKSTLLNALIGEELAIATRLPQTTRQRMLGVWNGAGFQAVLVDTPGLHHAQSALNRFMVGEALRGAKDVDLILWLAEAPVLRDEARVEAWEPGPGARAGLEQLAGLGPPILLVLTKCDQVAQDRFLLPILARWQRLHDFVACVPVAALRGEGLGELERAVTAHLPPGPRYFEEGQLSDRNLRWHASELIRAEIFARLGDELPYSCAVVIDSYREGHDRDRIHASIHVERDSQKGIVVGRAGRAIKEISQAARGRIEALVGRRCDLFVEVRVTRDWTKDPSKLGGLGYAEEPAG